MKPIVNDADIQVLIKNPFFAHIHDKYGPPPNWSREPGFVSLSTIILEQQVSLASALAHFNKLNSYIRSFTPEEIVRLSDEEMRMCQISRQKTKYLRGLSNAILDGQLDLQLLSSKSDIEIRKELTSLNGIGQWTTDIYLMFCLQAKDIFPIGDIAVVNTVKELSSCSTREEILVLSDTWQPHRSLAAYYCWHHYLSKRKKEL